MKKRPLNPLVKRLKDYKEQNNLSYSQLIYLLTQVGLEVNYKTLLNWITYHGTPSWMYRRPLAKAMEKLESGQTKLPQSGLFDQTHSKKIIVYIIIMQSGTKLIATPEGQDGKRQILYTRSGKPCESLQDISSEYTKTEQELFGQKIRPNFNKKYIEAEIPAVVQVPVDQRWSREIDF